MSTAQLQPDADPLYVRPLPQRPFYATGMLLDAQDFSDEQTYHRGRLAEAIGFISGGGTLAGLRINYQAEADGSTPEEIRVEPGVAVDRLGRLVEIPRPACLRLQRWFDASQASDGGDTLHGATKEDLAVLVSSRLQGEAGTGDLPALPARAVVADIFLRFVACAQGLTPSFASGPYDALDAVTTSRLQDAYELLLLARPDLDTNSGTVYTGLPPPPVVLPAAGDAERRAAVQDAVLGAWAASGRSGQQGQLAPLPEQPSSLADRSALFLGRVLIPVTADNPPQRDGTGVLVDNWSRRFVPSSALLGCWLGL
jgi:hypothetical protein